MSGLITALDLADLVRHHSPAVGHTGTSVGLTETLTDGLGAEVPESLLKAVTETATPAVNSADKAT